MNLNGQLWALRRWERYTSYAWPSRIANRTVAWRRPLGTAAQPLRLKGSPVMEVPATSHGADTRRHKLTGDVHLVLTNPAGEVLFGQRQNTGFEDGAWHLPSGHLEAGESMVAALIRETKEEIGVIIDPREVEFSHVMHNSSGGGRVAFFFTVRRWAAEPENREPDKCSGLRWFPLGALPTQLIPYCRTALTHIATDHCFSTFGW